MGKRTKENRNGTLCTRSNLDKYASWATSVELLFTSSRPHPIHHTSCPQPVIRFPTGPSASTCIHNKHTSPSPGTHKFHPPNLPRSSPHSPNELAHAGPRL